MARKLSFWEGMKAQFSTKCLVLIPIAVGINLIGGTLCSVLKLPLFLDMIGTIVVACLSGPWVAALTGLLTNLFLALVANPVYLPYAAVSVLCGLVVGYMVKAGLFHKKWGVVVIWLVCTFVNAIFRIADHHIRIRRCHRRQRYIGADGNAGRGHERHSRLGDLLVADREPPRQGHHCRHRVGDRCRRFPVAFSASMRPTPWAARTMMR